MEKRPSSTRSGWQRYGHLLWWVLLPPAAYLFYRNNIGHHAMAKPEPPRGALTIPLQPDPSDLAEYIYRELPVTIVINDTIKDVIERRESFVHVSKDSCWLEHVLTGYAYIRGKDSVKKWPLEIRDRVSIRGTGIAAPPATSNNKH